MPNLKSLKQLAKIAEEVAPAAKALSPAEQAVQLLKEKLTGQIRPEVLDKVLSSAAVPESEARSILEGNISPWTIRTDLPKDITIDEIIALGQQNIKPWSRNRLELPVDELWKHREYDRFGADRYKTSEELNALKESIEKEGIKKKNRMSFNIVCNIIFNIQIMYSMNGYSSIITIMNRISNSI